MCDKPYLCPRRIEAALTVLSRAIPIIGVTTCVMIVILRCKGYLA